MPLIQTSSTDVETTIVDLDGGGPLTLCRQELDLGGNVIPQYWVDKRSLVARNGTCGSNYKAIIDHFYHKACQLRLVGQDTAETHLLATLLPLVRHDKAQSVFPDASLKRRSKQDRAEYLEQLDAMVASSRGDRLKLADFQERTRNAVDFPTFSDDEIALYRKWSDELFDGLAGSWTHDLNGAADTMKSRWEVWRKQFGRRSGNQLQKTVLNVLSFESKAAFHQAYSVAWKTVLPLIGEGLTSTETFTNFHGLWHHEQRIVGRGSRPDSHLLHGLVLGLHPALGLLISTPTGRDLIGEMVAKPSDIAAQERFFNATLISIFLYDSERSTYNSSRQKT